MRKQLIIQYGVFTVVNVAILLALLFATAATRYYVERLDISYPLPTDLAIRFGIIWPGIACLCSLVGVFLARRPTANEQKLSVAFAVMAFSELTLLAAHLCALSMVLAMGDL